MPGRKLAYGSSVFALSEKGSTNALARTLADHENQSDLIGGVDLSNQPPDMQKTFIDLLLDKKIEHSVLLGDDILAELARIGRVHTRHVAQAGFMVLRSKYSVKIPSVLVETAFISTPEEERKLRNPEYQRQLAAAILKGLKRHFAREGRSAPIPQQVVANAPNEHVVKTGETLASIARQYNVNAEALRFLNELNSDELPAGRRLRLPTEARGI
jgi:N-acetylmuramoyl-L-alanine amidase